jgi:serine protease AprX
MAMRNLALIIAFLTCGLPACSAGAGSNDSSDTSQILLQGSSSEELTTLVRASGGTVTHDLHIIDAVGARLTQAQLDQILASPLITRHIKDLDAQDPPEESPGKPKKDCDVSGHLEADFDLSGIRWTLYNKKTQSVQLQSLELDWPEFLGAINGIWLGDTKLSPQLYRDAHSGPLTLQFEAPTAPVLSGHADLQVTFAPALAPADQADRPLRQRDFDLKASFAGDCSAKLIPGYDNNHENFYYSQVAGADALHRHGVTGKGVTVAVIDSGLWEHEALARDTAGRPRIVGRYDAITNTEGAEVFDESGHGTHMTSVIAHSGPTLEAGEATGSFKGVAPDVDLVAVKVLDTEGQGHLLDIIRAIQWVVDNREKYNIRVLNLSFAQRPRWPYWEDPVNQAVMRAWANGITVVAAAGNEGPEPMTIGSPGNLPYIITVGAVTDSWTPDTRSDDYIPDFSSRGPTPSGHIKPDVVAPGGHITGVIRPGASLVQTHPDYLLGTGEFVMTGSSQASALVSGIAALLIQLEPQIQPDDIKCRLLTSAEPAINRDGRLSYSPFQQGHGLVNIPRAVTLGQTGCGNMDLDLNLELTGERHFDGPAIVDEGGNATLPGHAELVSPEPSEKGLSNTRKWGVKAHIERRNTGNAEPATAKVRSGDWLQVYLDEKATIEAISRNPKE